MIRPSDVATALGRPYPSDAAVQQQWQMWIDDAAMLIQYGDGDHEGLGDLSALPQATLDFVMRAAVVAMVRRPDDATQVDISVDDGRVSKRYQSGTGQVFITERWWRMLRGDDEGDSGAFSVRPYGAPDQAWAGSAL